MLYKVSLPNVHFRSPVSARGPFALPTGWRTLLTILTAGAPHIAAVRQTVASD